MARKTPRTDDTHGMRLSLRRGDRRRRNGRAASLAELAPGEGGVLAAIDLPEADVLRLMELGFLPGNRVVAAQRAPGGDPRVFRVDGTEIALRKETARHLHLRTGDGEPVP
jgi:ferrous iron transport protein A